MQKKINRRDFCQNSLLSTAALTLPTGFLKGKKEFNGLESTRKGDGPEIIDTNINLFEYPFRNLKYSNTKDLVQKLKRHKITEAWACSFEALFHKNIDLANQRIVEECRKNGDNILIPVGTVNTTWPDWEEDLRRCHEAYKMKIIRIYPIYQMIELEGQKFHRFLEMASGYGMLIQIVGDIEDRRHHHPLLNVRNISFAPLVEVCKNFPDTKMQLLHWNRRVKRDLLEQLNKETHITFDISRIEGTGELGKLIHGDSWNGSESRISAERFLFGTHAPYFPVESALLKLFESPLSEKELKLIMRENAQKILSV